MRTTMNSIHQNALFNLSRVLQEMQQLNNKVTSGKELSRISDDPIRMASSLNMRTNLAELKQYQRNITFGESMVGAAEEALTQIQSVISDAKHAAVQLSSSSADPTSRRNSATLVRNFLEQAVSLANSQVAGRFLFGGFRTSGYTNEEPAPFLADHVDGFRVNAAFPDPVSIGTDPAPAAMAEGDLLVNGIGVGAAADDGLSTIYADASAAALAASINAASAETGVEAVVVPAFQQADAAVNAGFMDAGDLVINGESIFSAATAIMANDADNSLVNAINSKSALTGVTATRGEDGRLLLSAADGRNLHVVTSAAGEAVSRLNGVAGGMVHIGALQLFSERKFTLESTIGDDLAMLGLQGGEAISGEEGDVAGDDVIVVDSLVYVDSAVRYTGDRENNLEIAVGRRSRIEVAKNGQELFVDSGLFSTLRDFERILLGERFTEITGSGQATDTAATLDSGDTGLSLAGIVANGAITFTVTDQAYRPPQETSFSVPVDTAVDTPAGIAEKINGIPGINAAWDVDGHLVMTSDDPERYSFGFDDSSNFLQAAGVTLNQAQSQALQGIASELETVFSAMTDHISDLAAIAKRMEVQNNIYARLEVSTTETISDLEDADLAQAVMELKAKEVAYEAALAAAAKTLQMSLLNFL